MGERDDDSRFVRADDPSRQSNAFTISGILQDDDAQLLAHKRFAVSLDPSATMLLATEGDDESTAEVLDLAATETDEEGKFTVQVPALRSIDNYVEEDGSVGLMFHSLDDDFELLWRTPVYLPRGSEQQATAAVIDDEAYGAPDEAKRPEGSDGNTTDEDGELDLHAPVPEDPPTTVAVDDLMLKGVVTSKTARSSTQDVSTQDVGSSTKAKACNKAMGNVPWDNYGWKKKGPVYREWIPVQRAQTGNKTKMKFEWTNNKEHSTEILANLGYTNDNGGTAVSAGFSKSVKKGEGLTFNLGHNIVRDLDAEYDFATYVLRCKVSGSDIWRDSKLKKVQMYEFKGFSRKSNYTGYYTCPQSKWRGSLTAELWVSRESTSSFSFTLGGNGSYKGVGANLSLTTKQSHTKVHKKTYIPVKSGSKICGQNGNPTKTEKVSEVA